jgi:hypothetical protein
MSQMLALSVKRIGLAREAYRGAEQLTELMRELA